MRINLLAVVFVVALGMPVTTFADDRACPHQTPPADCHKHMTAATGNGTTCCTMPGCEPAREGSAVVPCHEAPPDAIALLMSLGNGLTTAEEMFPPETRQRAVVWFHRPVWVGGNVLMGKYIIEHDTARQERGEPCTHIYAADRPDTPVVAFHCTHLEAERSDGDRVVLGSVGDGARKLLRFQFAGDDAAHGVPAR